MHHGKSRHFLAFKALLGCILYTASFHEAVTSPVLVHDQMIRSSDLDAYEYLLLAKVVQNT